MSKAKIEYSKLESSGSDQKGFSHTTWITPPIHEQSGMGLPRFTLTYG